VVPTTSYARSGEADIAYQAFGDGPLDLVFVPGVISHLELASGEPYLAAFCGGLRRSPGPQHRHPRILATAIRRGHLSLPPRSYHRPVRRHRS